MLKSMGACASCKHTGKSAADLHAVTVGLRLEKDLHEVSDAPVTADAVVAAPGFPCFLADDAELKQLEVADGAQPLQQHAGRERLQQINIRIDSSKHTARQGTNLNFLLALA